MISYAPYFEFSSAPRTGTTWFVCACATTKLGERTRGTVHIPHDPQREVLRVSQVRHPCDWLASYYQTIKGGYVAVPSVDVFRTLNFSSFHQFVRSYLRKAAGAIGDMFLSYNATSYLRLEDQPFALYDLLESCDIAYDVTRIVSLGKMNTSWKIQAHWDPALYRAVYAAEKACVEEFEYVSNIDRNPRPS